MKMKYITKIISILILLFNLAAVICMPIAIRYLHLGLETQSLKFRDLTFGLSNITILLIALRFCWIPMFILYFEEKKRTGEEIEKINSLPKRELFEKPKKIEICILLFVLIFILSSFVFGRMSDHFDSLFGYEDYAKKIVLSKYSWIFRSLDRVMIAILGFILPPKLFREKDIGLVQKEPGHEEQGDDMQ